MSSEAKTTKTSTPTTKAAGLANWIDEIVNKKQPLQLPENVKKWIADNAWWIALISGVLSLWSALTYWNLGHALSSVGRFTEEFAKMYGVTTYANDLGPVWYVALVGILIQAALTLVAVRGLKEHRRDSWNLLFYASLVSATVGVLYVLMPNYGVASLISTVIGLAINWYFIFQVRSYFTK